MKQSIAIALLFLFGATAPLLADTEKFLRGNWQDPDIQSRIAMQEVHEGDVVGELYLPPNASHLPALLSLGACTKETPRGVAQGMADHGYPVLALFYCGPGTSQADLRETPIEIFKTAADWLARQPSVDPDQMGVIGVSAGASAALLAAANDPRLKVVVAVDPGSVVWAAPVPGTQPTSMYANGGVPLSFVYLPEAAALAPDHIDQMRDILQKASPGAVIPVEKINGPILLLSGTDDLAWPSAAMADQIAKRLQAEHFSKPYESEVYPGAGHGFFAAHDSNDPWFSALYPKLMDSSVNKQLGGTTAGNVAAQKDAWTRTLAFLHRYL